MHENVNGRVKEQSCLAAYDVCWSPDGSQDLASVGGLDKE